MLIIFIVLSGVWITCGTVFVVREVEVVDITVQKTEELTTDERNAIVAESGLLDKNILFNLDQEKITNSVKSVNPMLKLQGVTAEFPNRVVLTVSRRMPVYVDRENEKYFDAEMYVVDAPADDLVECIDITGANLKLVSGLTTGDLAVGKDEWTQCKIKQLKVMANYFPSLDGLKINYDDNRSVVGNYVCLLLETKPGVTYKIKVKPGENFLHALEFTDQIYNMMGIEGIYKTMYRDAAPGKVGTQILDEDGNNIMLAITGRDIVYEE